MRYFRSARRFVSAFGFGALVLAAGPLTSAPALGQAAPCPRGSVSAGAFRQQDIDKCVITTREGAIGLNQLRTYNIYCPGRMTQADADAVGRAIARDGGGGPAFKSSIHDEFRRHDLVAAFEDAPHVFHYGCQLGGGQGVATHVRLRLRGTRPSRVSETAASCTLTKHRYPTVMNGYTRDFEYQCKTHFMSNDARDFIYDVAAEVLRNQGSGWDIKYCVVSSTNIQCAPCTTSDKLVIRTKQMRRNDRCEAGTVREAVPAGPSER